MHSDGNPHPLQYEVPAARAGGVTPLRLVLVGSAVLGLAANVYFIRQSVESVRRASGAHRQLTLNPRAFGREISPATIESLRGPYWLWCAHAVFAAAAAFGALLALHLLVAAARMGRSPDHASRGLWHYYRWKPVGATVTAAAFLCAGTADHIFWVSATRHTPVGSGPPVFATAVLLGCALAPWWWIKGYLHGPPSPRGSD